MELILVICHLKILLIADLTSFEMLDVSLVILAVELDHDVSEILIAISVIIILCQIAMVMDQMIQIFQFLS